MALSSLRRPTSTRAARGRRRGRRGFFRKLLARRRRGSRREGCAARGGGLQVRAALGTALFFTACYWAPEKNQKNAQIMACDKKRKKRLIGPISLGAAFIKSDELRSRPAALFYVLLYAKSTIPNARHDSRVIFWCAHRGTPKSGVADEDRVPAHLFPRTHSWYRLKMYPDRQ